MTESSKNIIRNHFADYRRGNYMYRYDVNTGIFYRCRVEDYGRQWIDDEGRQHGAWEEIDRD